MPESRPLTNLLVLLLLALLSACAPQKREAPLPEDLASGQPEAPATVEAALAELKGLTASMMPMPC